MTLLKIKIFYNGEKNKISRNFRVTEMEKVAQSIEQTIILNLTSFMYMNHPVTLNASCALCIL